MLELGSPHNATVWNLAALFRAGPAAKVARAVELDVRVLATAVRARPLAVLDKSSVRLAATDTSLGASLDVLVGGVCAAGAAAAAVGGEQRLGPGDNGEVGEVRAGKGREGGSRADNDGDTKLDVAAESEDGRDPGLVHAVDNGNTLGERDDADADTEDGQGEDGDDLKTALKRHLETSHDRKRQNEDVDIKSHNHGRLSLPPVKRFQRAAIQNGRPLLADAGGLIVDGDSEASTVEEERGGDSDVAGDAHGLLDREELQVEEEDGRLGEEGARLEEERDDEDGACKVGVEEARGDVPDVAEGLEFYASQYVACMGAVKTYGLFDGRAGR